MKSNIAQLAIAKKYLGQGCRRCCNMGSNCCCDYVYRVFKEAGNSSLFYGGRYVAYVPNAESWCRANLAEIPLFLAMPSDIITYDWNLNGTPDHIGFVVDRVSDTKINTLEANTTDNYVVAYRTRPSKYVSGLFRPQFAPPKIDTNTALVIDGQFGYHSIAMLQKALGIKVDGILGKQTVKSLQKKVGVAQDGSWKMKTSKAVQQKLCGFKGSDVDGWFGEKSVKALQKWINANVKTTANPTPVIPSKPKPTVPTVQVSGKLVVDGNGGTATVKAMQKFFGTTQDSVISGQIAKDMKTYAPSISAYKAGKGGSACVKKLQRWVGVFEDGYIGIDTVKAWQKKIGVTADGCFGTNSMKAWQKYLNTHDKPTYPTRTIFDDANDWAERLCKSENGKYRVFNDDPLTQICPICHPEAKKGMNCIQAAFAYLRHGAGIPCRCNAEVINDTMMDKLLRSDHETAVRLVQERTGMAQFTVVSNNGNAIPTNKLQKGDVIIYYDGKTSAHMGVHIGGGKLFDCARGHTPQMQCGKLDVEWWKRTNNWDVKIVIRYTGKLVK